MVYLGRSTESRLLYIGKLAYFWVGKDEIGFLGISLGISGKYIVSICASPNKEIDMAGIVGSQADLSLLQQKHPNLLRILQELTPSSPVLRVKDPEQPSQGYLRPRNSDPYPRTTPFSSQTQAILQCKALKNEKLAPTLRQEVALNLSQSLLLQKRKCKTC